MTSVRLTGIIVTSMLSVIIPRDLIIVPVSLDTLEMEVIVLVISCSYSLFVYSICMIEVYTRFIIVMKMKSFVCRPSVHYLCEDDGAMF